MSSTLSFLRPCVHLLVIIFPTVQIAKAVQGQVIFPGLGLLRTVAICKAYCIFAPPQLLTAPLNNVLGLTSCGVLLLLAGWMLLQRQRALVRSVA